MAAVGAAFVLGSVGVAGTAEAANKSVNAKTCQKGGWQTVVRSDQTAFASQDACVSYAARGGVLTTPTQKSAGQVLCEGIGGVFSVPGGGLWACTGAPDFLDRFAPIFDQLMGFWFGSGGDSWGIDFFAPPEKWVCARTGAPS